MLTPHCSAASGMVMSPSIASITRLRKSSEYGFAIHAGLLPAGILNHIRTQMGITRINLFGKRSKEGKNGNSCDSGRPDSVVERADQGPMARLVGRMARVDARRLRLHR